MHIQGDEVHLAELDAHLGVAGQALGAHDRQHQRNVVGAHHAVFEQAGGELGDAVLLCVTHGPEALHGALVPVVGAVSRVKRGDDGEQLRVLRLERGDQRRRLAVACTGNDLPLVHQVGIAAQWRGRPRIRFDADTRMRQGLGAHAHLDAGRQRRLAAVNAGHTHLGEPAAPGAVGQNHGFGHDQVQRGAALADADEHGLVALRLRAIVALQAEVVVRAVEGLGFAAHDLALGLQVPRQAVQK